MEAEKLKRVSVAEYKAIEKEGNIKYEFHDGILYAMAGGSFNHGLIVGNIFGELHNILLQKDSPCFPLNNDVKLHIETENRFLYPDTMVICKDVQKSPLDSEAVTNPILIIEVLSKSTASYDRGDKFYFYRQIMNLQEYVLIEQEKAQVEVYTIKSNLWNISRVSGLDKEVVLHALSLTIPLSSIYRNVAFPSHSE